MNNFFDIRQILLLIWRHKYPFLFVGILAILLSAVFSGPAFIKPKYQSSARIYPTNMWVLSEESEAEQMLEIVNSNDIKQKMFDVFDLEKVYEVNPNDRYYMTYMLDIYNKNVNARKTKLETVEIKVRDHDPHRASDMCDSIIHFFNQKVRDLHRIKELEMVEISEKGLDRKYAELRNLISSLDSMRNNYGILDYHSQAERVTEGYMAALASGRASTANAQKIKDLYDNLATRGADARWLESRLDYMIESIDSLTNQYDFYLMEYEKDITYAHVVESPMPADKKAYPVRWLIVVLATASSLFLALLILLVLDYRKNN